MQKKLTLAYDVMIAFIKYFVDNKLAIPNEIKAKLNALSEVVYEN